MLALGAAAALALPAAAAAQDVDRACAVPGYRTPCVEAALGLTAARAAIGLAAAGGADLTGTNSTLGMRIGSVPRLALDLRVGLTHAPVGVQGDVPARDETAWLPSVRADAAVGLFDGFSTAPTVGGILAVDLVATGSWVGTSADDGFEGGGLVGGGVGLRLGVFRESFTLPGVTLTATRRWMGETRTGAFGETIGRGAEFDNTVTSVRAVVGKDLFAVGFLAGVGWERYGGSAVVQAWTPTAPTRLIEAEDLDADRALIFGGVSWNFLVLQLSAEAGWADGFDDVEGRGGDGFDPGRSTFFGAVALRLIL